MAISLVANDYMFNLNLNVTALCWYFKKVYLKVLSFLEADLLDRKIQDHFNFNILIQHSIYSLMAVENNF